MSGQPRHTSVQQPEEARVTSKTWVGSRAAAGWVCSLKAARCWAGKQLQELKVVTSSEGAAAQRNPSSHTQGHLGVRGLVGGCVSGPLCSKLELFLPLLGQWRGDSCLRCPLASFCLVLDSRPSGVPGWHHSCPSRRGYHIQALKAGLGCPSLDVFVPKGTLSKLIWLHKGHLFPFGVESEGLGALELWQAHPSGPALSLGSPRQPRQTGR